MYFDFYEMFWYSLEKVAYDIILFKIAKLLKKILNDNNIF